MIKDRLENAKIYYPISENLKKGFEWLLSADLQNIPDGRYEIDGNKVYASVQEYETKPDASYESHYKYIDIQYIVRGIEKIGVTNLANCKMNTAYDSERDLEFYDITCEDEYLELSEGEFLVLYPHDAHKPSITKTTKSKVKKIVVKVAI